MLKRVFLMGLLVGTMLAGAGLAEGLNEFQIPADVNWVVHFDAAAFQRAEMGQTVMAMLDAAGMSRHMATFEADWQFNPRDDVAAVTMYGQDRDCDNAVILIHGLFNEGAVSGALRKQQDYGRWTYRSLTVHEWFGRGACGQQPGRTVYGTFYNNTLIVLSAGQDTLKKAIDTLVGYEPNLGASAGLAEVREQAAGALFVAGVRNMGDIRAPGQKALVLRQSDTLTMSLRQDNQDLRLNAVMTTADAETAANVLQVLQGLRAFALMAGEERPALAALASATTLRQDGAAVILACSHPWRDVLAMAKARRR